jgi:hypothetical protein
MQAFAASQEASDGEQLRHVGVGRRNPRRRRIFSAASKRSRFAAASVRRSARAIGNCTPWFWPIGRSKTMRSFA